MNHHAEISDADWYRIVVAQDGWHVRLGTVVHGPDAAMILPRTACGVRWVPGASNVFPQGVPTRDPVDCMACLVAESRK